MYQIRQAKIKDFIQGKQIVTIRELRDLCPDVSLMTLHRDLDALANDGSLIKLRGGIKVIRQAGESSFQIRQNESMEAKKLIAKKAVGLLNEGGAVFFDAGTTTLAVIKAMPDINLTVITNGANFAGELQRFANITAYICCGVLNKSHMALSGHGTLDFLSEINIDVGFIGVSGYSKDSGFTCGIESDMHVKKLVIGKARKSVVLMDAAKLSRLMPYTFASLEDIDCVIGDDSMPDEFLRDAREAGVTVL